MATLEDLLGEIGSTPIPEEMGQTAEEVFQEGSVNGGGLFGQYSITNPLEIARVVDAARAAQTTNFLSQLQGRTPLNMMEIDAPTSGMLSSMPSIPEFEDLENQDGLLARLTALLGGIGQNELQSLWADPSIQEILRANSIKIAPEVPIQEQLGSISLEALTELVEGIQVVQSVTEARNILDVLINNPEQIPELEAPTGEYTSQFLEQAAANLTGGGIATVPHPTKPDEELVVLPGGYGVSVSIKDIIGPDAPAGGETIQGILDAIKPYIRGIEIPDWLPTAGIIFLPSVGEILNTIGGIVRESGIQGALEEGDYGEVLSDIGEILVNTAGEAGDFVKNKIGDLIDYVTGAIENPDVSTAVITSVVLGGYGNSIPDWLANILVGTPGYPEIRQRILDAIEEAGQPIPSLPEVPTDDEDDPEEPPTTPPTDDPEEPPEVTPLPGTDDPTAPPPDEFVPPPEQPPEVTPLPGPIDDPTTPPDELVPPPEQPPTTPPIDEPVTPPEVTPLPGSDDPAAPPPDEFVPPPDVGDPDDIFDDPFEGPLPGGDDPDFPEFPPEFIPPPELEPPSDDPAAPPEVTPLPGVIDDMLPPEFVPPPEFVRPPDEPVTPPEGPVAPPDEPVAPPDDDPAIPPEITPLPGVIDDELPPPEFIPPPEFVRPPDDDPEAPPDDPEAPPDDPEVPSDDDPAMPPEDGFIPPEDPIAPPPSSGGGGGGGSSMFSPFYARLNYQLPEVPSLIKPQTANDMMGGFLTRMIADRVKR